MEFPPPIELERVYTLPRTVSAIQILPAEEGENTRMGLITQLPEGAEIEVGGPGFRGRSRYDVAAHRILYSWTILRLSGSMRWRRTLKLGLK